MKKISLLFTLIAIVAFTFKGNAQINLGLTAGVNMANVRFDYKDGGEPDTKFLLAPRAGLTLDLKIPGPIGIGSGLFYSVKGYQTDIESEYNEGDGTQSLSVGYLELPVHLKYNIAVLNIYAGPYVAMGIHGKQKNDYTYEEEITGMEIENTDDYDVEFTSEADEDFDYSKNVPLKSTDMGLNFGLGVKLAKIAVNAGYSMGLSNISPDMTGVDGSGNKITVDGDDFSAKTSAIQLGLTYYF